MIQMPTESEPVSVIQGDAVEVLRSLPDGFCDHIITDPPYAEKTHAGARTTRPGVSLTTVPIVTFDSIGDDFFLNLCEQCVRVASRWVLMTCDWRHAALAVLSERGVPVIRTGVWIKPDSAPQFTGDRPGTGWEAILLLHRKGWKRWNGGGHHATWTHPVERNNLHPTQKPLALVRKWVKQFTDPGDLILDPFAGSGTTGHAALSEGRRAILIERNPAYVAIAQRRIGEAMGRGAGSLLSATGTGDLFAEKQP